MKVLKQPKSRGVVFIMKVLDHLDESSETTQVLRCRFHHESARSQPQSVVADAPLNLGKSREIERRLSSILLVVRHGLQLSHPGFRF